MRGALSRHLGANPKGEEREERPPCCVAGISPTLQRWPYNWSILHQLISFALDFFHTPGCIKDLVAKYFADLQMCCAHQDFTTGWQQLKVGVAMGCSISPILFIAAFEIGARKVVG